VDSRTIIGSSIATIPWGGGSCMSSSRSATPWARTSSRVSLSLMGCRSSLACQTLTGLLGVRTASRSPWPLKWWCECRSLARLRTGERQRHCDNSAVARRSPFQTVVFHGPLNSYGAYGATRSYRRTSSIYYGYYGSSQGTTDGWWAGKETP
jgi:hypothetical protein